MRGHIDNITSMPHYELKLLLFSTWAGEPILCYDPVHDIEILVVTHDDNGNGPRVCDMAVNDRVWTWTGTGTILEMVAKFDSWNEAKSYFTNKAGNTENEALNKLYNLYVQKAASRIDLC